MQSWSVTSPPSTLCRSTVCFCAPSAPSAPIVRGTTHRGAHFAWLRTAPRCPGAPRCEVCWQWLGNTLRALGAGRASGRRDVPHDQECFMAYGLEFRVYGLWSMDYGLWFVSDCRRPSEPRAACTTWMSMQSSPGPTTVARSSWPSRRVTLAEL